MGLGLAIGLEHAFESDHVAAVATQMSKRKKGSGPLRSLTKSSLLGVLWGAGHTTTLVLVGLLVYGLAVKIQEGVFSSLELGVGIMLVFLGITTVLGKGWWKRHRHPHKHTDGTIHFDEHRHNDPEHRHGHKSYIIGLVHGLAGSGSLVALTATTFDDTVSVLSFVFVFGMGSIIGMVLVTSLMGLPFVVATKRKSSLQRWFRYVAGGASIAIGIGIIYSKDIFVV